MLVCILHGKSQRRGRGLIFKVYLRLEGKRALLERVCKGKRRLEFNLKARELLPDKEQGPITSGRNKGGQADESRKF